VGKKKGRRRNEGYEGRKKCHGGPYLMVTILIYHCLYHY